MENLSTDPAEQMASASMDVDVGEKPSTLPTAGSAAASSSTTKEKPNAALHHQIKQIKPLLSGSSRLGRALAELFALLVKLCVGSPLRQRRGQQVPPTPVPPTVPARAVATALTRLLASGLSWEPPPTSPVPRFRLTFFICSVGFTAPMLFDEKKYPYHLMLMKFMSSGGQRAFFDTFYWSLSCGGTVAPENGLEHPDLPEGTGEFLDSWLLLLEKMVNPKTVQDSPHTLPPKGIGNMRPFDPMKYLSKTHKLAFLAVMKIWGKKPLKVYGARMADSVLSILCHILKGEKLIDEKQEKERLAAEAAKPGSLAGSGVTGTGGPSSGESGNNTGGLTEPAEPDVNQAHMQSLMDMGFPRDRCVEALQMTDSLEQATDYLLHYPLPALNALTGGGGAAGGAANVGAVGPAPQGGEGEPRAGDSGGGGGVGGGDDRDELMRAIAMSLGENVMVSTVESESGAGGSGLATGESEKKPSEEEEEEDKAESEAGFEPLDKAVINDFTDSALSGCLSLLDTLPDTVYRVCDLLLAVFNRNGLQFKEKLLRGLIEEVRKAVHSLLVHFDDSNCTNIEAFSTGVDAQKASARIHLFTLLFEDCKILCAKIVHESKVAVEMTLLLECSWKVMEAAKVAAKTKSVEANVPTPRWMTPMLLFIDLHEKVLLGMNRRAKLANVSVSD